jgi:exosortase family protein XrtF
MESRTLLQEFRPAIKFLLIFVVVYLTGNVIYGIWIEQMKPRPDQMTIIVTNQTVFFLKLMDEPVAALVSQVGPTVSVVRDGWGTAIRVFEGCNGINVMIVFIAFLVAFGGNWKSVTLFTVAGLVIIHIANLLRIGLLYYTAVNRPQFFYYFHKYFFTGILYSMVFILWYLWVNRAQNKIGKFSSSKSEVD